MEDALRVVSEVSDGTQAFCLNPCSNGRCSAREYFYIEKQDGSKVLILVLMEDALRVRRRGEKSNDYAVLILVLMEDALRGGIVCLIIKTNQKS